MMIQQLQLLFFHILDGFLDIVGPLHCLLDCLDWVRLIMTELMLRLLKRHMWDSNDFAEYLNKYLKEKKRKKI